MPDGPVFPGVYVEEQPGGIGAIAGVPTSIAAFVDSFERGPLHTPVHISSMADFQREFGGLSSTSEASYGIHQFFLNGGREAWVVRTAGGSPRAASVILGSNPVSSRAAVLKLFTGRRNAGVSVEDPGSWGNSLRADIDYASSNPAALFNLTVSETTARTVTFRDLSMANAAGVVNGESNWVQAAVLSATARPAPTGTASRSNVASPPPSGLAMRVSVNGGPSTAVTVAYQGEATLSSFATLLQAELRKLPDPYLAGASVHAEGARLRLVGGRDFSGYEPSTVIRCSGPMARHLRLENGHNVQQYQFSGGASGALPDAAELTGAPESGTGLHALDRAGLFNILCLPRAAALPDAGRNAVYSHAQTYCLQRRAMLLIDLPETVSSVSDAASLIAFAGYRGPNAAVYFPRVRIPDPLDGNRLKTVAASGTIAGVYARFDVWKAPAGREAFLSGVPRLAVDLNDADNDGLLPLGINALRNFPAIGPVCWGARTLAGAASQASEWKYVPVRRMALFLEESIWRGTQWAVFEPNAAPLWAGIRQQSQAFLYQLFLQGAFQGVKPEEAFLVSCGTDTTTANDIEAGVFNILIGFAPLKPAEFVFIRITQHAVKDEP